MPVAGEGSFRVSQQDVKLGDLTVPAGVFVWAFFLGGFTHPKLWDDPDAFRPVRSLRFCRLLMSIHVVLFWAFFLGSFLRPDVWDDTEVFIRHVALSF